MATIASQLLEFLMNLMRDPQAAAEFNADPEGYLASSGLANICSADVEAVAPVVLEHAVRREFGGEAHAEASARAEAYARAEAVSRSERDHDHGRDRDHDRDRDQDHDHAVTQLTDIVNNFEYTQNIDDRDTNVDQSVRQNIWTDGGDVKQWFDNDAIIASGDDSIAAGGDAKVDNSTDNSTNVEAHDSTVKVGTTDVDIEDSFNDNSDRSTNVDFDATDSFNDESTNVDVDIEDSFTQDNDGIDVENVDLENVGNSDDDGIDAKDADIDVDASDNSTHDNSTTVSDNEVGNTNVSDNVVIADNEVGNTEIEDNVVVQDSFDDNFSDNFSDNELEVDGVA